MTAPCDRCIDYIVRLEELTKERDSLRRDLDSIRQLSPARLHATVERLRMDLERERLRATNLEQALRSIEEMSGKKGGG